MFWAASASFIALPNRKVAAMNAVPIRMAMPAGISILALFLHKFQVMETWGVCLSLSVSASVLCGGAGMMHGAGSPSWGQWSVGDGQVRHILYAGKTGEACQRVCW